MTLEKLFLVLNSHFSYLNWEIEQPFMICYQHLQLEKIIHQATQDFEQAFQDFKHLIDCYHAHQDILEFSVLSFGIEIEQRLKSYACYLHEKYCYLYLNRSVKPIQTYP